VGEMSALLWLASHGALAFIPVAQTPTDSDLIADFGDGPLRVQAKTSAVFRGNRWEVTACTRGGNQSWNGLVKRLDPVRYDHLFVHVADGRRWFIASAEIGGGCAILLGGAQVRGVRDRARGPSCDAAQAPCEMISEASRR